MMRFLRKNKRTSGKKEASLEARLQAMEARLHALEAKVGGQEGEGADVEQAPERAEDAANEEAQGGVAEIDATEDCEECVIGESIWDSPAFMGLPGFGDRLTTVLLLMTLLASVSLQVFFCHTFVTNTTFYNPGYWQKEVQTAEKWRLTDAHDYRFSSLQGVSLVSRVCLDDSSLSVASGQKELLSDIDNYMDAEDMWKATGPRLAMVCVTLFVLMVMEEQRASLLSMRALLTLPIGSTRVQDNHLVSISKLRLVASLGAGLVRIAISIAVLCAGVVWLATTAKASDLILNNAALGFVFAIDELLVNALVPAATQNRLRTLEPVRVRRLPLHLEAVLPWAFTAAIAAVAALLLLQPQATDMAAARSALCSGRRDFTVYTEPEGIVSHAYTAPASLEITWDLQTKALQELRASGLEDKAFIRAYSLGVPHGLFGAQFSEGIGCYDLNEREHRFAISAVQEATGRFRSPFACEDYQDLCGTYELLRRACPVTCGCRLEPWSALFQTSGCPESCMREGLRKQRENGSGACIDRGVPPGYLRTVRIAYLQNAVRTFSEEEVSGQLAFLDAALAGSCRAPNLHIFCNENDGWLEFHKGSPVHRFCPELCCNGNYTDPQGLCPRSCPASAERV